MARPGGSWLKTAVVVLILLHFAIGARSIALWFRRIVVESFLVNYNIPVAHRLYTMGPNEYQAILQIWQSVLPQENIIWGTQISPMINYYIYPRKIYQQKMYKPDEAVVLDRAFVESRRIRYVFVDYGKLFKIKNETDRVGQ